MRCSLAKHFNSGLTLLSVVAATLFIPPSSMEAQAPKKITEIEGITEYQLDNGVNVLLFPDDSKPEFTINMTIMVGSRHEGYGETGMAHLLEHMLFKGTSIHKDIPKLLKDRGVLNMNGTTSEDRTNYYETLPASDDNLKFAIHLEADRLVNSLIRGEDLLSEMTVVRNEFERGENSPRAILRQRIMATAFEWHNYGKTTIGNRSDIERVPVGSLRAFYRKFYQPDNITVVLAGKFDQKNALKYLAKYFGTLQTPQRELPKTYTEEPAQDGERVVNLRRVGDTQVVGMAYHIVPAAHKDFAAMQVLSSILSSVPSGPLYKTLVETELASSTFASAMPMHDPGVMIAMAELPAGGDLAKVQQVLIEQIESVGSQGVDADSVKRAKKRLNTRREAQFANTEAFALGLSEWQAFGDWRLYFLHRDRVEKVSVDDVQRVAKQYLVQSNRTVGVFRPTESPVRAPVVQTPDLSSVLASYKGRKTISKGEAFEPTPDNIESRTTTGTLGSGMQYALLPKETRGNRVALSGQIHYGDLESLNGRETDSEMIGRMLTRGTLELNYEEFRDRLDEINTRMNFGGGIGVLSFSLQTKRENLSDALDLLRTALRKPLMDESAFEIIKRQSVTQMESMRSDPQSLAMVTLQRKISPYKKGDPRYIATVDEDIERIKSSTIEGVKSVHAEFLNGKHGQVAIVGDFDADQAVALLDSVFADWSPKRPYSRIPRTVVADLDSERISIETPDKKMAVYLAAVPLQMRNDDENYESLLIGNYIMGGGPLSSRLADRVRKKDGLSYGVGSQFRTSAIHKRGIFQMFAISNPKNSEKVVLAVADELSRIRESGVTADELENAKKSYLQTRQGSRSQDQLLANMLINNLETGRTMEFQQLSDDRIRDLTKEKVDAAIKKYMTPKKMVIVTAGDFESVKGDEKPKDE